MTTELPSLISRLEAAAGDPRSGLPTDIFLFVSRLTALVNVDLLIQDEDGRTLLTWRDDEFYGPGWHVPGSIIRFKESIADRIRACAQEELGAKVSSEPAPLLIAETIAPESTRGHFISLLFRCRLVTPPDPSKAAAAGQCLPGQWRWHDRCPPDLLKEQRAYAPFF